MHFTKQKHKQLLVEVNYQIAAVAKGLHVISKNENRLPQENETACFEDGRIQAKIVALRLEDVFYTSNGNKLRWNFKSRQMWHPLRSLRLL